MIAKDNRIIIFDKPVLVYKNLHKDCWSIKQNGLVVAYSTNLCLQNCTMKISEKSRQKVISERKKNVHAYISGYITDNISCELPLYYNPYQTPTFVNYNTKEPILTASFVQFIDNTVTYRG